MVPPVAHPFQESDVEAALAVHDVAEEGALWQEVSLSCTTGDAGELQQLIAKGADIRYQEPSSGLSALMLAAAAGQQNVLQLLLMQGAPWNALDKEGKSAGDHASTPEVERVLLDWGVRCEIVLSRTPQEQLAADSEKYLKHGVNYEGGNLIDEEGEAVMMDWEKPLMLAHANLICQSGGDVLNVGFGLGLVDEAIQGYSPKSHTIIEAHPDVYKKMIATGWDQKPNVRVLFGRWQDVVDDLQQYDGIFFDTFAEHYDHMRSFHALLPKILKKDGIYSFFNGLAPRNPFFSQVYRHVVAHELEQKDLKTEYMELPVNVEGENWNAVWEGIKSRYWHQSAYYLPIVYWLDEEASAAPQEEAVVQGEDNT